MMANRGSSVGFRDLLLLVGADIAGRGAQVTYLTLKASPPAAKEPQAGCPSRSSGNSRPVRSKNNGVEANVESKHTTSPHPSAHTRALSKPLHRRQEDLFLPPTAKRTARLLSDCKHG